MRRAATLVGLIVLAPALLCLPIAWAQTITDDQFIEELGQESAGRPVDRKRLARVFFSLAATLEGGKSSVELQHASVMVPDTSRQAVQSLLRARFSDYSRSLDRFRSSVTQLLDEPQSLLAFNRVLVDSQRTCWHFDLHNRLIETYGSESDLFSILSSREACSKLRRVVFQPRVEAILADALVERVYERAQLLELQADLRELEQLFGDLREIDEAP